MLRVVVSKCLYVISTFYNYAAITASGSDITVTFIPIYLPAFLTALYASELNHTGTGIIISVISQLY